MQGRPVEDVSAELLLVGKLVLDDGLSVVEGVCGGLVVVGSGRSVEVELVLEIVLVVSGQPPKKIGSPGIQSPGRELVVEEVTAVEEELRAENKEYCSAQSHRSKL